MAETRTYMVRYLYLGGYVQAFVTAQNRERAVEIVSRKFEPHKFKLISVQRLGKDEGIKHEFREERGQ